jgi:hypothetical protein
MKRRMLLWSTVAALLLVGGVAEAKRTTVVAKGQSVIAGGKAIARAQAINAALRHAVEQVAQSIGAPAEGEDAAVDKAVYARAAAFVPATQVTGEEVDLNVIEVEVTVEVDVDALTVALGGRRGAVQARARSTGGGVDLGGKRVLILATEQLGPHQIFGWTDYVWGASASHGGFSVYGSSKTTMVKVNTEMGGIEATMADGFTNAGFHVVDPHVLKGHLAPKPAMEVLDLSPTAGRSIAEKADADLVVVVKGVAKDAYHETLAEAGMHSGQANVVARLVRVRDGKVLASSTQHAAQVHIDLDTARLNALNEAARMAAQELTKKLDQ